MEEPDQSPVFHSYLCKTQRQRLVRPDGSFAGWLIFDNGDIYTEFPNGVATSPTDSASTTTDVTDGKPLPH